MNAPEMNASDRLRHEAGRERDALREQVAARLAGRESPRAVGRLAMLAERFSLDDFETDALAALWVGAFDADLRAGMATLEPQIGQLTVRGVARLFGHPLRVRLPSESPLLQWLLAREHALLDGNAVLVPEPAVLAWLEGGHELDPMLAGRARLLSPGVESPAWPLAGLAERLHAGLGRGQRWRVHLATEDALAARWFAAALGQRLGLPVLDVPAGTRQPGEPEEAIRLHRQAFLDGCIPCVALADAALTQPAGVVPYPLQIVHGLGPLAPAGEIQDVELELPSPDADERERLWRALWPECAAWPPGVVADLALCHEASAGDIAAAAGGAPRNAGEAALALRERARGDLGPLARRMDAGFTWDDLVLPAATEQRLRELAFEARTRARLWADPAAARLFPYGSGLVALFAGSPGTGKTMAAQVIAADLGLDLLAVDLSAVVSKWVGETAQHLQALLGSRAAQRAILFFDEADALYAKRVEELRDAQDRFANLDTSHLMTALESYPGIVLLASNLKGNIDSAFLRRIRHVVDFPKPDAPARERLWRLAVAALFGKAEEQRLAPALSRVARIEATGAQIKNGALSAVFATRRTGQSPDARLLGQMLARELAKEGAGLSERELAAMVEDGA